jgi:hypothetical protein
MEIARTEISDPKFEIGLSWGVSYNEKAAYGSFT